MPGVGRPRCPRCGSTDVEPCSDVLEASCKAENVKATHRCLNPKCREPFRYTPPTPGFTGTDLEASWT